MPKAIVCDNCKERIASHLTVFNGYYSGRIWNNAGHFLTICMWDFWIMHPIKKIFDNYRFAIKCFRMKCTIE